MLKKSRLFLYAILICGFIIATNNMSATAYTTNLPVDESWALLNLLSTGITVLLGYALIFSKYQRYEIQTTKETTLQRQRYQNRLMWACIAVAFISILSFFLTESIQHSMTLVDQWTIFMILFPLIQIYLFIQTKDVSQSMDSNSFKFQ